MKPFFDGSLILQSQCFSSPFKLSKSDPWQNSNHSRIVKTSFCLFVNGQQMLLNGYQLVITRLPFQFYEFSHAFEEFMEQQLMLLG
jgi:hypothetical protein